MQLTDISEVGIVGSGVIGGSWAVTFSKAGFPTHIFDVKQEALDRAKQLIETTFCNFETKGIMTAAEVTDALAKITYTLDMETAVKGVQFIQESGPENYDVKHQIIAGIEKYAAADTIIASSTSGLLITEIAQGAEHPERILGAHPYNPPHLIPLVELAKGDATSEDAIQLAKAFYQHVGKEAIILKKEALGFIANRLQAAILREVCDLVMRGVCTVEDADKALLWGPGLRWGLMGPMMIADLAGGPGGYEVAYHHMTPSVNLWLADMADFKTTPDGWLEAALDGLVELKANRRPEVGQTYPEIVAWRDDALIELLRIHKKL